MKGRVVLGERGKFYLELPDGPMEMDLVPEGYRKLAMIAQLASNGALGAGGFLFWDEPEANLNPKLIKKLAPIIFAIAQVGVQVFVASHSLFLLRELDILHHSKHLKMDVRYFGLRPSTAGGIAVRQGPDLDSIGSIAALDEELLQTDRYLKLDFDSAAVELGDVE